MMTEKEVYNAVINALEKMNKFDCTRVKSSIPPMYELNTDSGRKLMAMTLTNRLVQASKSIYGECYDARK